MWTTTTGILSNFESKLINLHPNEYLLFGLKLISNILDKFQQFNGQINARAAQKIEAIEGRV